MDLVRMIAARIYTRLGASVELDELMAAGQLGLLEAAQRYDPGRSATFATFACYRIRGAVYDHLRRMGHLSRRDYREQAARSHSRARRNDPRALPSTAVDSWLGHLPARTTAARDGAAGADEDEPAAFEPALGAPPPAADRALLDKQRRACIERALPCLSPREQHLVRRCFFDDLSVSAAGAELGLSRSWSTRMLARAMERLHRALARDGIRSYDDA